MNEVVGRRGTGKKKKRNVLTAFLIILVLCVIGTGIYGYIVYGTFNKVLNNLKSESGNDATLVDNIKEEPFAVLILGMGTNGADDEDDLADAINVLVVNPEMKYAEVVAVPRDSYLQRGSMCEGKGYYDKATHASGSAAGGEACMETTLEELFDFDINYYVSLNFLGFINIVNALGGVEMNVPDLRVGFEAWTGDRSDGTYISPDSPLKNGQQWCESDSMRNPYTVCFDKFGPQIVDGEHALALARTRHYDSDFGRSMRQAELIKTILNKATSASNILTMNSFLESIPGNVETNIDPNQFLDFATLGKQIVDAREAGGGFEIRTTQLEGRSGTFDGDISGTASYNLVPIESIEEIRRKIANVLDSGAQEINAQALHFETDPNPYDTKYSGDFLDGYGDVNDPQIVRQYRRASQSEG